MARRQMAILVALAMLWVNLGPLAEAAWAQDAWRKKPYTEWDAEVVQKLLSDSPWVKRVRIPATWKGGRGPEARSNTGDRGLTLPANPDDPPGQGRSRVGLDELADQARAAQAEFRIRWNSSRPVRQALVRAAMLQGRQITSEAERYIVEEPGEFEVVILGQDMEPFQGLSEEALKEKTYIRPGKGSEKISPTHISFLRQGERKQLAGVAFFFPRKTANGEAVVAGDEKRIEFFSQAGPVVVRSNFEPQKMVDQIGLAL